MVNQDNTIISWIVCGPNEYELTEMLACLDTATTCDAMMKEEFSNQLETTRSRVKTHEPTRLTTKWSAEPRPSGACWWKQCPRIGDHHTPRFRCPLALLLGSSKLNKHYCDPSKFLREDELSLAKRVQETCREFKEN